jgi:hypothetical protein
MRVWGRSVGLNPPPRATYWEQETSLWGQDTNFWFSNYQSPQVDYTWEEVDTDTKGYNDAVYVTALCQVLQLQTGESPFWAQYGIPAQQSVTFQAFPDASVYFIQQQYAKYFAALKITKINQKNQYGVPEPVYSVNIVTHQGSIINLSIPVPQ